MALTFTEKFRASLGGKEFRAFEITCDGSVTSITAANLDMAYIDNCIITCKADLHSVATTWDPASLADGAGDSVTIAVTGAVLGDYSLVANPEDLVGILLTSYVQSAGWVEIRLQNEIVSTVDLASNANWLVRVLKHCGLTTTRGEKVVFFPALQSGDIFTIWAIGR